MDRIDARGLACPKPVMLTKEAVDRGLNEFEVLVDNPVGASNVQRFLQKNGFAVSPQEQDGLYTIGARREGSVGDTAKKDTPESQGPRFEDVAVLVCQSTLGGRDQELGEVLIKGFLSTLADREVPPRTVALMNEGVMLALPDHSASDSLKQLEERGVNLLVCGTCTTHFGVTDQVRAGTISNMFEITEALLEAKRTVTLG
jgi:selenium metabolism protein YedF